MSKGLIFEWDFEKAKSNLLKHGVSFEESATAFGDVDSLTINDPTHSVSEIRKILLGMSSEKKLLVVVFTERKGNIRIISARKASRKEKVYYEN